MLNKCGCQRVVGRKIDRFGGREGNGCYRPRC